MKRGVAIHVFSVLCLALLGISAPKAAAQANILGQWSTLSYQVPINPVHAALLHTGKVLIVSGSGNDANNFDYEAAVWDPQAGTITTQPVGWDMFCNGMAVLPDGRPFIAGGTLQYDPFHGELKSSVFDPSTGIFSDLQSMAHGRWYPTLTGLADGRIMIFSGLDEHGGTNEAVEFYTVGSGWSQQYSSPWNPPLYPRMHLLPSGTVLYSGSGTSSNLFDPTTQNWTLDIAQTQYNQSRTYGTAVLLPLSPANNYDAKVMIMGGGNPATATTEIIDMGSGSPAWQYGPNMSQPRIEMNAVILPSGRVLALGGSTWDEDESTASLNADLYDPASNTFSPASSNVYPRVYHSVALLLPDATVWLAGGNPNRGTFQQNMEVYQPAYLFTTDINGKPVLAPRPSISSAPGSIAWGAPFTVSTPDAGNISSVVLVRAGSVTHAFDMDQRLVSLSFTQGAGTLTVTAPPNGNIAPPGYYMLFLLNSSGVPSVASFVQLVQPQADFTLSVIPASRTISRGGATARYKVTVTAQNGFSGSVSLSASGLPSHTRFSFAPPSLNGSGSSTFKVAAARNASPGTFTLTITGTSGSLSHSTSVGLTIQ